MVPQNAHDADFLRSLIDAIPAWILVVDEDVRILDHNTAAGNLLGENRGAVLQRRGGEVLHCIHSAEVPEGCGRAPFCRECVVRNSVNDAFAGQPAVRRRVKMELTSQGAVTDFHGLICASLFSCNGSRMVLLMIEDIGEILELHKIVPICAKCKRIQSNDQYWMRLEAYFRRQWDLDFSHGLCPTCAQQERAKLDRLTILT